MAVPKKEMQPRWVHGLRSAETLADDLGVVGAWVGPRTGPNKRSQGEKEDYVLRRVLVARNLAGQLSFPVEIRATEYDEDDPDFIFGFPTGQTLGLEVTEAGEEDYQKWLTQYEKEGTAKVRAVDVPLEISTERTVSEIRRAIEKKVARYDKGKYRAPDQCDLVVYDNTASGGFLDKEQVIKALGRPNHLLGRFRQIHVAFEGIVFLDVFGGECLRCDVSRTYEIDYARWIFDQIESLRQAATDKLDLAHIAEELEDLGRSERRALGSHLKILVLHLLKWQFQPEQRSQSWSLSIDNARSEIFELLTENPSLRGELTNQVVRGYARARREAARETGLSLTDIPDQCPYELEQLLDDEFLPDQTD